MIVLVSLFFYRGEMIMNENYNYVSMTYRTRQLKKELIGYGCIDMEPIQFNSIKRKFSIKKLNKNNIFKNCVKINQNFSENMITALGSSNTQCIYDVIILFMKTYLQDWLNMRHCVNCMIKVNLP